jgi:hypothetical protein
MDAESKIDDLNMAMLRLFFVLTRFDSIRISAHMLIGEKTMISMLIVLFVLIFCFRLQEKISNMESDEKVQRQALLSTPVRSMSEHLSIPIVPKVEFIA